MLAGSSARGAVFLYIVVVFTGSTCIRYVRKTSLWEDLPRPPVNPDKKHQSPRSSPTMSSRVLFRILSGQRVCPPGGRCSLCRSKELSARFQLRTCSMFLSRGSPCS